MPGKFLPTAPVEFWVSDLSKDNHSPHLCQSLVAGLDESRAPATGSGSVDMATWTKTEVTLWGGETDVSKA